MRDYGTILESILWDIFNISQIFSRFNSDSFFCYSAESSTNPSDITVSDVFQQIDSLDHTQSSNECVICFERKPEVILPCAHSYCPPCIEE